MESGLHSVLIFLVFIVFTLTCVLSQTLTQKLDLLMKRAPVTNNDEYLCSSYKMPNDEQFIVQFEALADAGTAHHILLFGCDEPASNQEYWHCGRLCKSQEQIVFAWAKNAQPLKLLKDVGFRVGGQTNIKYIVIQIHYVNPLPAGSLDTSGIQLTLTTQRQRYEAGIYLLLAYSVVIPGNRVNIFADISCQFKSNGPIYPFGFRTHAHSLGTVISGYQFNGTYNMIGKGNPQWPQAFYPAENKIVINRNDYLVGRCTYNSTGRDRTTYIGATHNDEMCNFYIMYYAERNVKLQYHQCAGNNMPRLINNLPSDSYKPLPPNPLLEMAAHGPSGHMGDPKGHTGKTTKAPTTPSPTTPAPTKAPTTRKPDTVTHLMDFESDFGGGSGGSPTPGSDVLIGQVGGVASDKNGNVYVFHRGGRTWNGLSFNMNNEFQQQDSPIQSNTIIVYDREGMVIRQFGKNRFFMPHGITVDDRLNVWVTDVGLHQVMRFPAGSNQPDLTLGVRFKPGKGKKQFCKPSDVAVLKSGVFFVSDGYCNSRIIKYDSSGTYISEFGSSSLNEIEPPSGTFNIPHSLALAEDKGLLCVADRENGRIQCFDFNGNFQKMIKPQEFGSRLFAISYCPLHGGLLFAVNGPAFSGPTVQGFILDINDGELIETWNAKPGLKNPHDIQVDPVNLRVYVGELDPTKVWRFDMKAEDGSGKILHGGTTQGPAVQFTTVNSTYGDYGEELNKKSMTPEDEVMPAIIIGALLVIPIIIIVVIVIVVRVYRKGQHNCCRRHRSRTGKKFNLGNFLTSHRGFDRLSQEESDTEFDPLNEDSDEDDYVISRKA